MDPKDQAAITDAVDDVEAYSKITSDYLLGQDVIQDMIDNVSMSGVVLLTRLRQDPLTTL